MKKSDESLFEEKGKENFRSKRFFIRVFKTRCRYHDDDDDDDEAPARRDPEGREQNSVSQSNQIQFSANGNF